MNGTDQWLTTQRLALRRFVHSDLEMLDRLNSDPEVMRHSGGPASREDTEAMLSERIIAYYDQHPGLGMWVTLERSSGACIGLHLLNHIRGESLIQVGYRLFPQYWGRGYATEMCVALLRYGFADLKLPRIVAIVDLPNLPSQKVLLKARLHRNGERAFAHPAYASAGPLAWFERDRASWLKEDARDGRI
jgi:RimJ/RimL family protein N-acetyltransferase